MKALVDLLLLHGVLIVFLATLAARLGLPLPAAPLLVVAGGLAAGDTFSGVAAFVAAVFANVLGDAAWFWGGRRYGHRVMRLLCRLSMSPDSCVRQSESLIARWGGTSLIAAKFVPGVSVVAAPMAGALAMRWRVFVAYDLLGGALWSLAFLGLGALFRTQIELVLDSLARAGAAALLGLVLVLAGVIAWRWWRRRLFMSEVNMPRIDVDELRTLLEEGREPVVVDVRSEASLAIDTRRIPGAISLQLHDLQDHQRLKRVAADLPHDREIVLYCNCPNEVSAARAARLLAAHGLQRVRPLAGGLEAWVAAEAGAAPLEPPPFTSAAQAPTSP